jgi:AGZA family xanthine/uracil permease-like MFS transporter
MIERLFHLKQNNTTISKELVAGITTFMTMAYILAANPEILGATGMDKGALFTTTAISAIVATFIMAFVANLPFALAPGMGLNAFFAYTVVLGMGYSWQTALSAIFIEGILFILLTIFNVREYIVNSIPMPLKHAISVGIGFFIALMGFINSGIIIANENTLVSMGNMSDKSIWIALTGLMVIGVMLILKLKGAILTGILAGAIVGIPLHITSIPSEGFVSLPPSIEPIFLKLNFREALKPDILLILFTFLFVDMFDTVGTLIGVSSKADMLDKNGKVPRAKQALFADAIGTTIGALLGTSTVTTYVESSAGVSVGGRTGLTALIVALCFVLVLFLSPVFLMIPPAATAPALIIIGLFMITPITRLELENYLDSIPVFLTIVMMPLAFSISEGISFGIISYVLLRVFTGRYKQVPVVLYILMILFIARYCF